MAGPLIDRISVELARRCGKACAFCYNGSSPDDTTAWDVRDVIALALDCARHGVRAISFGGGEPLEYPPIFALLGALDGVLARTLTTNGLPLERPAMLAALVGARPDKVHVSIHAPDSRREVDRVIATVAELAARGVPSGVNLLVRRSRLTAAAGAARALHAAGIANDRIVYLPMRGSDTPSAEDIAAIAGGPFQSMSCLRACGASPRFVSIGADRSVAWCSYTRTRRTLARPDHAAIVSALAGLGLEPCDGDRLVKLATPAPKSRGDVTIGAPR